VFPDLKHVNLESLDVRQAAIADPRGFLQKNPRGAILDEIHRCPDMLSYIQPMIDEDRFARRKGAFWVPTGSHNLSMLKSVPQSLAGRTAVMNLLPFLWNEIAAMNHPPSSIEEATVAGGYPAPFDQQLPVSKWLSSYVTTYVERDARSLTAVHELSSFQQFLALCAGRTAQLLNLTALAADCGIAQSTAKAWMSILETTYIAFRLRPWIVNAGKRLVKMPKFHFYDTGLVCWLLGIRSAEQLRTHPLRGPIFETWVTTEILKHRVHRGELRPLHFYRDAAGREADVLVDHGTHRTIVEAKSCRTVAEEAITATAKVAEVLDATTPNHRVVIFGGDDGQRRTNARVVPWGEIHSVDWM